MTRPDRTGPRALARMGVGLVVVAVAVLVVARIAASPRSALLFADGDSMLPVLFWRSVESGQPQDWALSSVLFLPELAIFGVLWMLRLGPDATIVVAAVVSLVALFGALRLAAGPRTRARMPLAGALAAYAVFGVLAVLDHTANRDSLELASLLTTTTYYSATVIGAIVAVGLLRRALDSGATAPTVGLAAVAAASVLTNPLFLLWATGPLLVVLAMTVARRPDGRPRAAVTLGAALVGGSLLGYLGRIPLQHLIANDGLGYIDPAGAGASVGYYAGLLAQLWSSPAGVVATALTLALVAVAAVAGARLRGSGASAVALYGWIAPVLVIVAAIVLGTHAARYLQPAVFAPVAALVVAPEAFPRQAEAVRRVFTGGAGRVAAAAGVVVAVLAAAAALPSLATPRTDADLDCVVSWVDASGRTGAGQYWTVRLPKTRIADPRRLVQVDAALDPYEWISNRADTDAGTVSFLILDAQSAPFTIPGADLADAESVACGRYTIADFGERMLPLGIPHS